MATNTDVAPFEVIVAPYEIWLAATGTTFPTIEAEPAMTWVKLGGTNGNKRYTEDGVTVRMNQTLEFYRVAGLTQPVKASRTQEDLIVTVTCVNLSLEEFTKAVENATVVDTAASASPSAAGFRTIELDRGFAAHEFAVLIRGNSPYGPAASGNWNMQFQVYRAVVSGNPEIRFTKGQMAGIAFEFTTVHDPTTNKVCTLVAQDADPG